MQDLGKGLQPIGFISKSLKAAEQNYSMTERELLAIVHATHEWRHLLQGRQYVMQGDHKPLEALMSPGKELTRRQARWVEKLIEVGVPEMLYVPGNSSTYSSARCTVKMTRSSNLVTCRRLARAIR